MEKAEMKFDPKFYGKKPNNYKIEAVNEYLTICENLNMKPMQHSILSNKSYQEVWDEIFSVTDRKINKVFKPILLQIEDENLRRKIKIAIKYLYDSNIYITLEKGEKLLTAKTENEIIREYKALGGQEEDFVRSDFIYAEDFSEENLDEYNEN